MCVQLTHNREVQGKELWESSSWEVGGISVEIYSHVGEASEWGKWAGWIREHHKEASLGFDIEKDGNTAFEVVSQGSAVGKRHMNLKMCSAERGSSEMMQYFTQDCPVLS